MDISSQIKKRINWLDVAKALGIWAIYVGHINLSSGEGDNFYVNVLFSYHVFFFFFLSGMSENLARKTENFVEFLQKNIKALVVPMFLFSFLTIIVNFIDKPINIETGIFNTFSGLPRNSFCSYSLWFLGCLFIVRILFYFMKKIDNVAILCVVSLSLYMLANKFLISEIHYIGGHWPWTIESVLYYQLFYTAGFLLFKPITSLLELNNKIKNLVFVLVSTVAFFYTIHYIKCRFCILDTISFLAPLQQFGVQVALHAFVIIFLNISIAKMLENVTVLNKIGESTLHLCGWEFIVKFITPCIFGILGLSITINTLWANVLYCFLLLLATTYLLMPCSKMLVEKINNALLINGKEVRKALVFSIVGVCAIVSVGQVSYKKIQEIRQERRMYEMLNLPNCNVDNGEANSGLWLDFVNGSLIEEDQKDNNVLTYIPKEKAIEITGWAYDVNAKNAISALIVKVSDKIVVPKITARPDVASIFGLSSDNCGFEVEIPNELVEKNNEIEFYLVNADATAKYGPITFKLERK